VPGTHRELLVTLGDLPPVPIRLDGVGATLPALRTALEQRLRLAHPDVPAFAGARVLDSGLQPVLVIVPGVPGPPFAFAPSPDDPDTVGALGLDPTQVRWADGLCAAAIVPRATLSAPSPSIELRLGLLAPTVVALPTALPTPSTYPPATWLAVLASMLQPLVRATSADPVAARAVVTTLGDRLLLLPGVPDDPVAEFLVLDVTPAAPLALARDGAALLGNVARASHGETVRPEILGDGDATVPFQHFTLGKAPVTHLPDAPDAPPPSSLELLVNGERWLRVPTLHGRAPDDPVYVARASDDGRVEVRFGDGVSGARVPTGRANVVARYRQGAGLVGRVPADALGTLLDRPQGLRGVINPLPSDGGADPETLADARRNAPATVRTFGRAVALRDFEDVVRSSGEVAKALATWVWTGRLRAVHVTVAAAGGARLSADALARLHDALDRQRDVNIPLRLANHEPVSVVLEATLRVDERRVQADVLAAARAAIEGALAFDAVAFGASMNLSDVYRVLQDVPGVMSVDVDRLHFRRRDAAFLAERGATADAVQGRLVIFAARSPAPGGTLVRPAELARLEVPAQDVTLRAVGGLPGAGGGA
jgi:hypothetical protein